MKIVVAGGTGFVGKALVKNLLDQGHEVIILTRKIPNTAQPDRLKYVEWLSKETPTAEELHGSDIFINLAGESINSVRWTEIQKKSILNSRLNAVHELLTIMKKLTPLPKALLNASAIGYYGTSEHKVFTEKDKGTVDDFLSQTVMEWENAAAHATTLGIRTVFCRFGVILDQHEGALPKMVTPYKAFIGGNLGHGRQWMSWIHIEDVVRAMTFVMNQGDIQGPVNFTAPHPVSMEEFGRILASVLHRPHWLPVPGIALKLLLGEMSTLVLDGQKVLPQKLVDHGYQFKYPELRSALKNIFA